MSIQIIAHRGASHEAPENTLAAFKLGWEQQADAVELDIHLTRDGHIVVIHDKGTRRTTGLDKNVADQTLDELCAQDAGLWKESRWEGEKIPALPEVLAIVPHGQRLFLEIKCGPEVLPELERQLNASGKEPGQFVIISFDYETVRQAKERFPHRTVYWLVAPEKGSEGSLPPIPELIEKAKAAHLDGLNLNSGFAFDAHLVVAVKAAGLKLYVWTVDDPAEARQFANLGLDGITTNLPSLLRQYLAGPR